jgi:hypothetical protein
LDAIFYCKHVSQPALLPSGKKKRPSAIPTHWVVLAPGGKLFLKLLGIVDTQKNIEGWETCLWNSRPVIYFFVFLGASYFSPKLVCLSWVIVTGECHCLTNFSRPRKRKKKKNWARDKSQNILYFTTSATSSFYADKIKTTTSKPPLVFETLSLHRAREFGVFQIFVITLFTML